MSLKYKLNCNVNLDLPYPPIKTDSRNLEDAYAMLSNVGSSNSEMCAVSLYFYNSVILKPEYADFAECFHKISIVEMHHLDIYSSLACQMGLDPRLWSVDDKKCAIGRRLITNIPRELGISLRTPSIANWLQSINTPDRRKQLKTPTS